MSDFQVLIEAKLDKGSVQDDIDSLVKKPLELEIKLGDSFKDLPNLVET